MIVFHSHGVQLILWYVLPGPIGDHVRKGTTILWVLTSNVRSFSGWYLCWTQTRPATLQTLSLARNYIEGPTDSLEGGWGLQTLILSSNLLSCEAVRLDRAERLGQLRFVDPSVEALHHVGRAMATSIAGMSEQTQAMTRAGYSEEAMLSVMNPFASIAVTEYSAAVLAFAGNPEVTVDSALIGGRSAGRLLKRDVIRHGASRMLPGTWRIIKTPWVRVRMLLWLNC